MFDKDEIEAAALRSGGSPTVVKVIVWGGVTAVVTPVVAFWAWAAYKVVGVVAR